MIVFGAYSFCLELLNSCPLCAAFVELTILQAISLFLKTYTDSNRVSDTKSRAKVAKFLSPSFELKLAKRPSYKKEKA